MKLLNHPDTFLLHWNRWAVGFFLLASILGLVMRAFLVFEIPVLEYRNILHTHSHLALLGWGFMILIGSIVGELEDKELLVKKYRVLGIGLLISILGMTGSFPVQGYGAISITFSTLFVLISYGVVFKVLKTLQKRQEGASSSWVLKLSLIGYLISTLGLWSLGPVMVTLGRMHELYFMTIQWFLHFQLNAWFVLGALGLILLQLEKKGYPLFLSTFIKWALPSTVVLTYALVVTWAEPDPVFFWINGLAVILQGIVYWIVLNRIFPAIKKSISHPFSATLIRIGLGSLAAKAILQLLLVIPQVAVISYTIRMYVIGFLHLVLLGAMSLLVVGLASENKRLALSALGKWGWSIVVLAFLGSEVLLFGQGTLVWLKQGYLDSYHTLLFWLSTLFPTGLSLVWMSLYQKSFLMNSISQKSMLTQIKTNTMNMKMIGSMGILVILLTACGGGSNSTSSSETQTSEAVTPAAADPNGIGEIKNVDLGSGIDASLADQGKAIVDMKCTACHQLNDKRLVGPGFQGVTNRRRPEWIMNMITNVDVMLDQDPAAQKLLEECLTRMPNQNITMNDARGILEFMRKNDEEKAGQRDAAVQ